MTEFLIGLSATLVGALLTFIFRNNLENIINSIFKNIYAKIEGEWEVFGYFIEGKDDFLDLEEDELLELLKENESSEEEISEILKEKEEYDERKISSSISDRELFDELREADYHIKLTLTQVANKVTGEINHLVKGVSKRKQIIQGKITPSRIVILNSEDKSEGHHNFGTYLVKLNSDSTIMKGFETYLCSECEDTASSNVIMEKIK